MISRSWRTSASIDAAIHNTCRWQHDATVKDLLRGNMMQRTQRHHLETLLCGALKEVPESLQIIVARPSLRHMESNDRPMGNCREHIFSDIGRIRNPEIVCIAIPEHVAETMTVRNSTHGEVQYWFLGSEPTLLR